MSLTCLDSSASGTLKRQIIEKEDISLTGIACYSLSQLKLLSMALELMLSLPARLNPSMGLPLRCALRYLNSESDTANARWHPSFPVHPI